MLQDPAAMVIDHTSFAVSDTEGAHTLIASDDFIKSDVILGKEKIEASLDITNICLSFTWPMNNLVIF